MRKPCSTPSRTLFTIALLTAALGGCASEAGVRSVAVVRVAPPAPRREVLVARPGPGFVWVGGYWRPQAREWVWVAGRWQRPPRAGAVWVAPRYERRRGSWVIVGAHWR